LFQDNGRRHEITGRKGNIMPISVHHPAFLENWFHHLELMAEDYRKIQI